MRKREEFIFSQWLNMNKDVPNGKVLTCANKMVLVLIQN